MNFQFTYDNLKEQYQLALEAGYKVVTCRDYVRLKREGLPPKTLVNRVDIDLSVKKTSRLLDIFEELKIKATFFLRLHAPEYNPFSFSPLLASSP